jgi:hypothetical protein
MNQKKYSIVFIEDQNILYSVKDDDLREFFASHPGIFLIQEIVDYKPPVVEPTEEKEQRLKYEKEKRVPLIPLSHSDDL